MPEVPGSSHFSSKPGAQRLRLGHTREAAAAQNTQKEFGCLRGEVVFLVAAHFQSSTDQSASTRCSLHQLIPAHTSSSSVSSPSPTRAKHPAHRCPNDLARIETFAGGRNTAPVAVLRPEKQPPISRAPSHPSHALETGHQTHNTDSSIVRMCEHEDLTRIRARVVRIGHDHHCRFHALSLLPGTETPPDK